jgi:hypothetical protein
VQDARVIVGGGLASPIGVLYDKFKRLGRVTEYS